MRHRPRLPILLLLLVLACEPALRETQNRTGSTADARPSLLTVPPTPCTGCAVEPFTVTRPDGRPVSTVKEFTGDPQADYLLVIQDDGKEGTGAIVTLNGETVVGLNDLLGVGIQEIAKSVTLKAQNRLAVTVQGKVGAAVTVWVLSGADNVGPQGGTVVGPI